MKKFKYLLMVVLIFAVFILTGCGISKNNKDNYSNNTNTSLSGSASEVLDLIKKEAMEYDKEDEYGLKTLETNKSEITDDNVTDILGISSSELKEEIEDVVEDKPVDSWSTYSFVIVKVTNDTNVKELAQKITKNTNPNRFGCLKPDMIIGAYSGNYILMVASDESYAENIYKAFSKVSGNAVRIDRENDWSTSDAFFEE